MRKLISILLCLSLLLTTAVSVCAEENTIHIRSTEEFLTFAQNCRLDSYSLGLTVVLHCSMDLTDTDFAGIPIFSGTFDGNGNSIIGLDLRSGGSNQGLFRYLTAEATVRSLHVRGTVAPTGSASRTGGIAGSNEGLIEDCTFTGLVSGVDSIGGIAGVNAGIIQECTVNGTVDGSHFVGGIAGESAGVIRSCKNYAQINTAAEQNTIDVEDITMESLTDTESAATVTDIGGICGIGTGVIRHCENHGAVGYRQVGYNIGGIAGRYSGYVYGCTNYGVIDGRKEVGGIVGQLEPAIHMTFEEDTLQTLQGQMETMANLTDRTAANAQAGASALGGQLVSLEEQMAIAQDALATLMPDGDNPELPDPDSIAAAQNALSNSMSSISGTLNSMGTTGEAMLDRTSKDLEALSNQMNAISNTLGTASENLGGTVADASDADTPEDLTGKVEDCKNHATVQGDWNVGGIAGAISFENGLDPEDDLQISGALSGNFDCAFRAVVLTSENTGTVSCGKQNAGGVIGWMTMGLLRQCINTGTLDSMNADYVGGVAGRSNGYIRSCLARCALRGDTYLGGIAGSGKTVTDCYAMTEPQAYTENAGGILGGTEDSYLLETNYYLPIRRDIGGIDGISYDGLAQALSAEDFLDMKDLPASFRLITVSFLLDDGTAHTVSIPFGTKLSPSQIPKIPVKEHYESFWEGDAAITEPMYFDMTFSIGYTAHLTTLESDLKTEAGYPILLVQGEFVPDQTVSVTATDADGLGSWTLELPEVAADTLTLRLRIPEGADADRLLLYARSSEEWTQSPYSIDGSYLVFSAAADTQELRLEQLPMDYTPYLIAAGAVVCVLLLITVIVLCRKRKKK